MVGQDLPSLLSRFQADAIGLRRRKISEALRRTTPDAGSALLKIARGADDTDTRWLAIRGMGSLKFEESVASFLKQSLSSNSNYLLPGSTR